jgi:hypothetical protein
MDITLLMTQVHLSFLLFELLCEGILSLSFHKFSSCLFSGGVDGVIKYSESLSLSSHLSSYLSLYSLFPPPSLSLPLFSLICSQLLEIVSGP